MTLYIANSFSLGMLDDWRLDDRESESVLVVTPVDPKEFLAQEEIVHGTGISAVGHYDTAAVFSSELGRKVLVNRSTIKLTEEDVVLVGQLSGGRLPEGARTLPPGATIRWVAVSLEN